uniref:Uncharacterized protein n=1 Tax=Micrurus carvalhoi TaxID=3147026 RepID=A0A2H6NI62_9SAUR
MLLNALENIHYSERGILLFANILNTKNIYIQGSDSSLRTSLLLFGFNQKNDQGQQMVKLHSAYNLDIPTHPFTLMNGYAFVLVWLGSLQLQYGSLLIKCHQLFCPS